MEIPSLLRTLFRDVRKFDQELERENLRCLSTPNLDTEQGISKTGKNHGPRMVASQGKS
jgi:hypothetical protein